MLAMEHLRKMTITLRTVITSDATSNFRTVRNWGTPEMMADTYSALIRVDPRTHEPVGQFSHVVPYQPELGDSTWSANTLACNITNTQLQAIASLQQDEPEFTVDQKMRWLTWYGSNNWGAPMKCTGRWETATDARLIAAVWAGQPVELTDERQFFTVDFNGKRESIPMSRIKVFSDWAHISRTHPQAVQCTAVTASDAVIKPHGTIYLPLVFKTDNVWVFDRWLI